MRSAKLYRTEAIPRLLSSLLEAAFAIFLIIPSFAAQGADIKIEAETLQNRNSGGWLFGRLCPGGVYAVRGRREVSEFCSGNWVEYHFKANEAGRYWFAFSHRGCMRLKKIEIDGEIPSREFQDIETLRPVDRKHYQTYVVGKLNLEPGDHRLRITSGISSNSGLDWFLFTTNQIQTQHDRYDPTLDLPFLRDVIAVRDGRTVTITGSIENRSRQPGTFSVTRADLKGANQVLADSILCKARSRTPIALQTKVDTDELVMIKVRVAHTSNENHGATFTIGVPREHATMPRPKRFSKEVLARLRKRHGTGKIAAMLRNDTEVKEWLSLKTKAIAEKIPRTAPHLFCEEIGLDPYTPERVPLETTGDPADAWYVCPSAGNRPVPYAITNTGGYYEIDGDSSNPRQGLYMLTFNSLSRTVRKLSLGYAMGAGESYGRKAAMIFKELARKYSGYRFRESRAAGRSGSLHTVEVINSCSYLLPLADAFALLQNGLRTDDLRFVQQNLFWPIFPALFRERPGEPPHFTAEIIVPHYRNAIFATQPSSEVRVRVTTDFAGRILGKRVVAGIILQDTDKPHLREIAKMPPPSRHEFVFPVKVPVGNHQVRARLLGDEPGPLAEVLLPLYRYLPMKNEVTVDSSNFICVNGKRFFPIGLYGVGTGQDNQPEQIEEEMRDAVESGINCGIIYDNDKHMEAAYAAARKTGFMLIPTVASISDKDQRKWRSGKEIRRRIANQGEDSATLLWYLADEPDLGWFQSRRFKEPFLRERIARKDKIREADPYHPTWTSLAQAITLRPLRELADIVGGHVYPRFVVQTHPDHLLVPTMADLPYTVRAISCAHNGRRPGFLIAPSWESSRFYRNPRERRPNYLEQRCIIWSAIAEGSRGIVWYVYRSIKGYGHLREHTYAWEGLKAACREVRDLYAVVTADDAPRQAEITAATHPLNLHHLAKRADGSLWLIVTNSAPRKQEFTLRHKDLGNKALKVFKEARTVSTVRGVLKDEIPPYGAHIYTDSAEVPQAPTIAEEQALVAEAHKKREGNNFALGIHGGRVGAGQRIWDIEALNDGERLSRAVKTRRAKSGKPVSIMVHLAAQAKIDRVILHGLDGGSSFRVQANVGGNWVNIGEKSGGGGEVREKVLVCEGIESNEIRLLADQDGEYIQLKEIQVLGEGKLPFTPPYELTLPDYGFGPGP